MTHAGLGPGPTPSHFRVGLRQTWQQTSLDSTWLMFVYCASSFPPYGGTITECMYVPRSEMSEGVLLLLHRLAVLHQMPHTPRMHAQFITKEKLSMPKR